MVNVFCALLSGMYCTFVKHLLQIFTCVENSMFVRSVLMSWQIFGDHGIMHRGTHWLVFFSKKLRRKLVFGISVYYLALQSLLHCPDSLRCLVKSSFEQGLFWLSSQSCSYQFVTLLWLGDCTPYFQTDSIKVLCPWSWVYCAYNLFFDSMYLFLYS